MAVRVGGGQIRGRVLKVTRGSATRPSSGRVRNALFSMLDSRVAGASVLDLYAGTGALGIEALSRGAAHVDFVEQDDRECATLRDNLASLGYATQAQVHRMPVARALTSFTLSLSKGLSGPYDLVLMDPPYAQDALAPLLERIESLVAEDGTVVAEHDRRQSLPATAGALERVTERAYGETVLSIYRRLGGAQ